MILPPTGIPRDMVIEDNSYNATPVPSWLTNNALEDAEVLWYYGYRQCWANAVWRMVQHPAWDTKPNDRYDATRQCRGWLHCLVYVASRTGRGQKDLDNHSTFLLRVTEHQRDHRAPDVSHLVYMTMTDGMLLLGPEPRQGQQLAAVHWDPAWGPVPA